MTSGVSDTVEVVLDHEHSVERQLEFNAQTQARKAIVAALAPYLAPESERETFESDELGASALLNERGLYLSANGEDGISGRA